MTDTTEIDMSPLYGFTSSMISDFVLDGRRFPEFQGPYLNQMNTETGAALAVVTEAEARRLAEYGDEPFTAAIWDDVHVWSAHYPTETEGAAS